MKKCIVLIIIVIMLISGCATSNGVKEPQNVTNASELNVQATPIPESTQEPTPTSTQEPTPTSTQEPTPTPTQEPTQEPKALAGVVIGVDAGHQNKGNSKKEPVAPNSDTMKAKVTSGTAGVKSKIDEHKVNLTVALMVRDMLEEQGAAVVMTRTSGDVDISNVERAQLFNDENVDLGVRLHCNGSESSSDRGAFMLIPTENQYLEKCENAANCILDEYIAQTGLESKGITRRSDQTGFNWCERPVVNIEMGHMSNAEEDMLLTDSSFQKDMAKGVYNGIMKYFNNY